MSISASPGGSPAALPCWPAAFVHHLGACASAPPAPCRPWPRMAAHPLGIGALRMQIGALALWAWCACGIPCPRGCGTGSCAGLIPATLGLLGFQVFFFWGVQQAGVAVGTVTAIGFSPVMAAILARIILGERPARIWYPATGLALAGLVLLNLGSSQDTSTAALLLPLLAGGLLRRLLRLQQASGPGPTRGAHHAPALRGQRAPAAARPFLHAAALAAGTPRGWGWPCIWAS